MFRYIKGTIEEIGEDYLVLESNGIGYMINTSKSSILDIGDKLEDRKIYTHLNVREDGISLFGFSTKEELNMFKLLIMVSKIGPKVALGVLSSMTPLNIKLAILNEDFNALSKAPGIGKKTANRIILELKDKIEDNIIIEQSRLSLDTNTDTDEIIVALLALGYTRNEAYKALSNIDISNKKTEEIIKLALKYLSK
ncbi:Holliday junction branch migration protein RuvA [Brassicibacter mesophilus]|uniref:Holliday junction branch migration protein RuvA n=1 Tax=Brassicibacter mesophilus TaxID=745119 RepID=UPI003D22641E